MKPTSAYFGLVQFMPDVYRHEGVNLAVIVAIPSRRVMLAVADNPVRINIRAEMMNRMSFTKGYFPNKLRWLSAILEKPLIASAEWESQNTLTAWAGRVFANELHFTGWRPCKLHEDDAGVIAQYAAMAGFVEYTRLDKEA